MITSTPVSFSSARMLRPSRPMIRPFISSLGSSTSRVVDSLECLAASRCMATERMLRARRSASTPGLLLDLLQPQAGLVPCLLLDLGDQQLLRLRGAQAREPLELAALHALRLLQLLDLLGQVALAVLERLQAAIEVGPLDRQRLGLEQRPLLHPGDLLAPSAQLVGRARPVGAGGGRRRRGLGRSRRIGSARSRRHGSQSPR